MKNPKTEFGNVSQTEPTLTMVARFRHLTMKVQCFKDTLN